MRRALYSAIFVAILSASAAADAPCGHSLCPIPSGAFVIEPDGRQTALAIGPIVGNIHDDARTGRIVVVTEGWRRETDPAGNYRIVEDRRSLIRPMPSLS